MTDKSNQQTNETAATSEPLDLTNQIIAVCITDHDICPLTTPINVGGKVVDAVIRKRKAVVRDRINAVRFSIDMFDIELSDAVRAYIASQICTFGTLSIKTDVKDDAVSIVSAKLHDGSETAVGADVLLDHMDIGDYTNVAYLMGKS